MRNHQVQLIVPNRVVYEVHAYHYFQMYSMWSDMFMSWVDTRRLAMTFALIPILIIAICLRAWTALRCIRPPPGSPPAPPTLPCLWDRNCAAHQVGNPRVLIARRCPPLEVVAALQRAGQRRSKRTPSTEQPHSMRWRFLVGPGVGVAIHWASISVGELCPATCSQVAGSAPRHRAETETRAWHVAYTDDLLLVAESAFEVQHMISMLRSATTSKGHSMWCNFPNYCIRMSTKWLPPQASIMHLARLVNRQCAAEPP